MSDLLETLGRPADLRALSVDQLSGLAGEIRERIIAVVGKKGGHLASNLGVTELTIALHYCFDFSEDRLLWDVGHQCYPHKLLTGRHRAFDTLRTRHHLGRAFQIADDLLDRTGSAESLGKRVGQDRDAGKLTYPAVVGVEASRAAAAEQVEKAVAALAECGPDADDLRRLARFVVERDH